VEVPEVIAAELFADRRYETAHKRHIIYNNSHYSLDAEDSIEASALVCHSDNPEHIFAMKEWHCLLCRTLNSLPEVQGRRVEAYFILGKTQKEIADDEGVGEESVRKSISKGIKAMKRNYRKFEKRGWELPCKSHGI
jgi:RNA polymerase sigma-70 factor (ECF subfamily)